MKVSRAVSHLVALLLLLVVVRPATVLAQAPPGSLEAALDRVIRSGCAEGVPDLERKVSELQPGQGRGGAEEVLRACQRIARERIAGRTLPSERTAGELPYSIDQGGRGALVLFSTLYGLWVGVATDLIIVPDSVRTGTVPPLVGLAAGLGLSLLATHDREVTTGQAWTIITGLDLGSYSGALWAGALGVSKGKTVVKAALATGIGAGAVATAIAYGARPSAGGAEVVQGSGLWGFMTGTLAASIFGQAGDGRTLLKFMAVGLDGGMAAGALLARAFDVSRNRVLFIDAGTLAGLTLGFGSSLLIFGTAGNKDTGRVMAGITLGCMYAGMLTAAYLTRDMPADSAAAPSVPALVSRSADGHWGFGFPALAPLFEPVAGPARPSGVLATLLGGAW